MTSVKLLSLCGADLVDYLITQRDKRIQIRPKHNKLPEFDYPQISQAKAEQMIDFAERHLNPLLYSLK